ncbi:MAG: sulfatase [Planctomycetota bacterium]
MAQPNLLVITLHDTGRFFGCYGVPTVQTPHIDRLAAQGVRCTSMFCTSPVCSPSRGTLNTGLYAQTNGLMGLTHEPWNWRFNPETRHIADILAEAGYETVLARFQHEDPDAQRLGFQTEIAKDHQPGPSAAQLTADYLRERSDERPFYLQFGIFETHTPYDFGDCPPDDSLGVTIPPWVEPNDTARKHFAGLQGSAKQADHAVGIVLDALEQANLADNTIVVFTVDHGVEVGTRRAKWSCYDAGLEIAYLIRWPAGGLAGGHSCDALLSNVDHTPTMLDLLGIDSPFPPDTPQGVSFAQALHPDPTAPAPREHVFSFFVGHNEPRSIRSTTHKLIRSFAPSRYAAHPVDLDKPDAFIWETKPPVELYDLTKDPYELNNLADDPEHRATRDALDAQLVGHLAEVQDPVLTGPVRLPYYEQAIATLPDL